MDHQHATTEWHRLSPADISQIADIANTIHQDLPERDAVFLERIKLYPQGCLGLFKKPNSGSSISNEQKQLCGYIISHPIRRQRPPALDTLLEDIAKDADQYYIHDVAILPEYRGSGLAQQGIEQVLGTVATRYETSSLVSVYGTGKFWGKFGFKVPEDLEVELREKLRGYGDGARYLERKNG
ncbi:hypothetical protein E8E13_005184 [Curvularia kusanoi]|uniref:N-acetyltransferase domain-containing protein n=1 Tax=Curvularia kusanoi TaxID=90978 RepID=A0A9P4T8F3_CURKU|nr:hypothetical protein E8E13_005184 [Curvularia kusanoi]